MNKTVILAAALVAVACGAGAAPASQYTSAKIDIKPAVKASETSNPQTIFAGGQGLFIVVK